MTNLIQKQALPASFVTLKLPFFLGEQDLLVFHPFNMWDMIGGNWGQLLGLIVHLHGLRHKVPFLNKLIFNISIKRFSLGNLSTVLKLIFQKIPWRFSKIFVLYNRISNLILKEILILSRLDLLKINCYISK